MKKLVFGIEDFANLNQKEMKVVEVVLESINKCCAVLPSGSTIAELEQKIGENYEYHTITAERSKRTPFIINLKYFNPTKQKWFLVGKVNLILRKMFIPS